MGVLYAGVECCVLVCGGAVCWCGMLCAGTVMLCWCWVLCVCVLGRWSTSCDAASDALQCCFLVNVWNRLYEVCVYDPFNNLIRCSVYRLW